MIRNVMIIMMLLVQPLGAVVTGISSGTDDRAYARYFFNKALVNHNEYFESTHP